MSVSGRLVRLSLLPAAVLLPLVVTVAPASAHDSVVSTVPASASTLTVAPTTVAITLEEPPGPMGSSIAVTAPGGASVTSGAAVVSGSVLSVGLVPLSVDGVYTVAYRVVSDDGHVIGGTYTWTLATGRSASPTTSTAASGSSTTTSSASWWLPAALLAVALAVIAAVVVRRRRPPAGDV